jgi:hypothetical protein
MQKPNVPDVSKFIVHSLCYDYFSYIISITALIIMYSTVIMNLTNQSLSMHILLFST